MNEYATSKLAVAALFTADFGRSNLGALFALKGATLLQALQLPGQVTIVGIIIVTAMVNLLLGSAAAKWALLAPIFADPDAGRPGTRADAGGLPRR